MGFRGPREDHLLQPTSVYVADPGAQIAARVQHRYAGPDRAVIHCTSASQLLELLEPEDAVCIVADVELPGMEFLELLARLRSLCAHAPVLCMAEDCAVSTAVALMKAGAHDCIEKTGPVHRLVDKLIAFIEDAMERAV